jgi:hypothetical protein
MWLCLVPAGLGFAYAAAADAPANRAGSPLADVAVAMGTWVGALGAIGAVGFGLLAWSRG